MGLASSRGEHVVEEEKVKRASREVRRSGMCRGQAEGSVRVSARSRRTATPS